MILGLVLNAVALWNTRHRNTSIARLRAEGHSLKDEDVARLSPLGSHLSWWSSCL
ncbi:Tn3 family transposase [Streptomyces anulatus]|uniref:Tn3 family transposase n=1 Tax=Streptomyces anulatus TaxID=1892 RepID=UPI003678E5E8